MNRLKNRNRKINQRTMDIDYAKLAIAIVNANKMIDNLEQEKAINSCGINGNIKGYNKNNIESIITFFFKPKDLYNEQKMVGNLIILSTPLILMYQLMTIFCFIIGFLFLYFTFFGGLNWSSSMLSLSIAFLAFVIRSCLVMATKEIENIDNIQILVALLSSSLTFIAMIISVASLLIYM